MPRRKRMTSETERESRCAPTECDAARWQCAHVRSRSGQSAEGCGDWSCVTLTDSGRNALGLGSRGWTCCKPVVNGERTEAFSSFTEMAMRLT
eukprot:6579306-Prymnesium_polylepis.2